MVALHLLQQSRPARHPVLESGVVPLGEQEPVGSAGEDGLDDVRPCEAGGVAEV